MVIKKFRRFIMGLCISMSAILCAQAVVPAVYAEEAETMPETEEISVEMEAPEVEPITVNATSEEGSSESEGSGESEAGKESEAGNESEAGKESEAGNEGGSGNESEAGNESESGNESENGKESESDKESEKESESETEKGKISISISHDAENPKSTDKIKAVVKLEMSKDQKENGSISVKFDGSTRVSSFYSKELDGAKVRFTHSGGEQVSTMENGMDLSAFAGITDVTITPAAPLGKGTVELEMEIQAENEMTDKIHLEAKASLDEVEVGAEHDVNLLYCAVGKPVIGHPGALVQFGKDLTVKMEGINIHANHNIKNVMYTIPVPSFMSLKSIKAPTLSAGTVDVYVISGEDTTLLGENAGGAVLELQETPAMVMFVIHPKDNVVEEKEAGCLVLANDQKKNKTNYFGFQSNLKVECEDGTVVEKGSSVVGATLQVYKYTEPEQPQTGDKPNGGNSGNSNNGGGGSSGGGTQETEKPDEPETETPETEDPNKQKEEEAQKRKEEAAEALRKEEEKEKSEQRNLLLSRLNSIKSGVNSSANSGTTTDTAGTNGTSSQETSGSTTASQASVTAANQSTAAKKLYEEKKIAAIDESMIENLKPDDKRIASDSARELYEESGLIAIDEQLVAEKQAEK